jgi:hypothetical protein
MSEAANDLLLVLARTTLSLSAAGLVTWLLLWLARPRSPTIHRTAWLLVLLQGWLWLRVPVTVPYYPVTDASRSMEVPPASQREAELSSGSLHDAHPSTAAQAQNP